MLYSKEESILVDIHGNNYIFIRRILIVPKSQWGTKYFPCFKRQNLDFPQVVVTHFFRKVQKSCVLKNKS